MGTTPNYAWPYPELTDPPDGAGQIKALATAIDASMKYAVAPPLCAVRQTVAQSIPNSPSPYLALTFNVEDIDPLDMHASGASRMTVKVAGIYRLGGAASITSNATGSRRAGLFVNDVLQPQTIAVGLGASSVASALMVGSHLVQLAVNDWVELRVWQDSGGALNTTVGSGNQSWASMEWIRP